jgi:DNA-binding MarR family transcriptional regulator
MPDAGALSTMSRRTELAAPPVAQVAQSVQRLAHLLTRARAQLLDKARHDVEWSAHVLMYTLAAQGPMRSAALAEAVQADPSRISRQVAVLVRDGFVLRQADPIDGRACVLTVTAKARAALAEHARVRDRHFAQMLANWNEQDCARFAELLERFTVDLETHERAQGERGWAGHPTAQRC